MISAEYYQLVYTIIVIIFGIPDGAVAQMVPEEPMRVCEIRIRFNNGLVLSRRGGDVEEVISVIRKILS